MNTNSNVYTVIYTTAIVVVVAAVLAFASMSLKPLQEANIKAETISQMLAAAQFSSKEELSKLGNDRILAMYSENVKAAYTIDAEGRKNGELETEADGIELIDNLKAQNTAIRNHGEVTLPVYVFTKDGQDITVIPVYGAGLWGPIWGYLAFDANLDRIVGAYFDHESETPGLGAKIKDEAWFREQFAGKKADFNAEKHFSIVKGGAPEGSLSAVDAITGATMTGNGLDAAINTWLSAYKPYFEIMGSALATDSCCCGHEGDECCGHEGEQCCGHEGDECCGHEGNCEKHNKMEE